MFGVRLTYHNKRLIYLLTYLLTCSPSLKKARHTGTSLVAVVGLKTYPCKVLTYSRSGCLGLSADRKIVSTVLSVIPLRTYTSLVVTLAAITVR